MTDERNPTLDEIQKAARIFRHSNSVMALREILARITGEAITTVSDVPEDQRAAVIAALEGPSGASAFVKNGELDPVAIFDRFNGKRRKS